jgi:hypothetical protein
MQHQVLPVAPLTSKLVSAILTTVKSSYWGDHMSAKRSPLPSGLNFGLLTNHYTNLFTGLPTLPMKLVIMPGPSFRKTLTPDSKSLGTGVSGMRIVPLSQRCIVCLSLLTVGVQGTDGRSCLLKVKLDGLTKLNRESVSNVASHTLLALSMLPLLLMMNCDLLTLHSLHLN